MKLAVKKIIYGPNLYKTPEKTASNISIFRGEFFYKKFFEKKIINQYCYFIFIIIYLYFINYLFLGVVKKRE